MSDERPLAGRRVLLADNDADDRFLIWQLLNRAGADVTAVEAGDLAVSAWKSYESGGTPFHAAVLDQEMPFRRGIEVTTAMRISGFVGCIVGISSLVTREREEHWLAAGCDTVLSKEHLFAELVSVLRRCV